MSDITEEHAMNYEGMRDYCGKEDIVKDTRFNYASCVKETVKAELIKFPCGKEAWIPKTVFEYDTSVPDVIVVESWFVDENDLLIEILDNQGIENY